MLERSALREALRVRAHSSRSNVVALPLPEPARASAASARGEVGRIARSDAPQRILVGVTRHGDLDGVAAELRTLGAEAERFETIGVLAATVP
jgi:hypothetical protein